MITGIFKIAVVVVLALGIEALVAEETRAPVAGGVYDKPYIKRGGRGTSVGGYIDPWVRIAAAIANCSGEAKSRIKLDSCVGRPPSADRSRRGASVLRKHQKRILADCDEVPHPQVSVFVSDTT